MAATLTLPTSPSSSWQLANEPHMNWRYSKNRRRPCKNECFSELYCDTSTRGILKHETSKQPERNNLLNLYMLVWLTTMVIVGCPSDCLVINIDTSSDPEIKSEISGKLPSYNTTHHLFKRTLASVSASAKIQDVDPFAYLQRYGYMNSTQGNANLVSEDSFQEAVMNFQRFAGIPESGMVDNLTIKYMQMPRCGNKDRSGKGENGKKRRKRRRKKRYALQGSKWRRHELTYRISQYPTRFVNKKHEVDGQIEKAFKIWSQVAPIDFIAKKEGRVHIDIRFASGEHGDGDPFDGPGNTLAHAYFPQYGGDAHFDDQEYWTVDSYTGTNIFQVAAHELGHSLGLGHSSVREALMAPFYQKYKPNFKLHADDVLGIQALYGERDGDQPWSATPSSTTTTSTTSTESPESSIEPKRRRPSFSNGDDEPVSGPNLCVESSIDAITRTEDGNTYVFRGQYYWQVKNEGLVAGYPAKISRDWDGLPGNLDAALTWSDGKTFFFKGDKYWRFFNKRREPGYPKLISTGFAGIPNNVDAAFVWSGNGKTYFFKKDKYWRFDSKQEPPVSSQYPKSIKNWSGLPSSGIDGAFKWENGMTYFFKDDLYYRFDDREFEVDTSARPSFPRSTGEWWFGCTNTNLASVVRKPGGDSEESYENGPPKDESTASSTSSLLLFHRKPNVLYDNQPAEGSSSSRNHASRPSGNSISRSFFTGLTNLFPLTGSSSSTGTLSSLGSLTDSSPSSSQEDWSFHRGVGEEIHRLIKHARSVPDEGATRPLTRIQGVQRNREVSSVVDNSRWSFPLSSLATELFSSARGSGSSREESLSELRMSPDTVSG